MLTALAHGVGWPVAEGGSARITDAMAEAVLAAGGAIETGRWVRSLRELPPARAVLLDVAPRALLSIAGDRLPPGTGARSAGSATAPGSAKPTSPCPARCRGPTRRCRQAGHAAPRRHVRGDRGGRAEVAAGQHPEAPYVLVTQPGVADPGRAPAGRHTLWAYCHVPPGPTVDMTAADRGADRAVRAGLPGPDPGPARRGPRRGRGSAQPELRRRRHRGRDADHPADPVPAGGRGGTPTASRSRGLYLCSSSTPPLPGVHGRCGELAALTALRDVFGIRRPPDLGPPAPRPAAALRGAP